MGMTPEPRGASTTATGARRVLGKHWWGMGRTSCQLCPGGRGWMRKVEEKGWAPDMGAGAGVSRVQGSGAP